MKMQLQSSFLDFKLQVLVTTFFLYFFILFVSCYPSPHHACNQLERDSLLSFSHKIKSPHSNPLNWSVTVTNYCLWEGITCDSIGRITHLWLPLRGLEGAISPSLGNLTRLSHLNLSRNMFIGSLPDAFFLSLNRLTVLDLSFNQLNRVLPSSLSSHGLPSSIQTFDLSSNQFYGEIQASSFLALAWNLTSFNVSNNYFDGPIPSTIWINSPFIRLLDFSSNNFHGQISYGLGNCSKLEIFRAGLNSISGDIPYDIYKASSLREIYLPLNNLSGSIDDGVVHLTNLTVLDLSNNQLGGILPQDIGKLSNLEMLLLHTNLLNGSLPLSLMNCTNLKTLKLHINRFEGDISALNFSTLDQLKTLDLGNNYLSGKLPVSLYSCKSLTSIRLSNNELEGQIMPDILALQSMSSLFLSSCRLTNITGAIRILMGLRNLKTVILSGNFMDETFPSDEVMVKFSDGLQNLQILGLGSCRLTGEMPTWLGELRKLEVLDLSFNQITGSIPGWLGTLPNLFYIDLSNNLISGKFPKELCLLSSLVSKDFKQIPEQEAGSVCAAQVDLVNNNFYNASYQLYECLSNFPSAIYLRNNSLNGNIPIEIGQLHHLQMLDLSHNSFSGNIPSQISNISFLESLDLSGNHLSGTIPESLQRLPFLSRFSVAYNNLRGPLPPGGQFETFPFSSYEGNPGLCGVSLQRECPMTDYGGNQQNVIQEDEHEEEDWIGTPAFYFSMEVGFIVGFLGVCGTLLLNSSWRCAYFQFLNDIYDWLYVTVAVNIAKIQKTV